MAAHLVTISETAARQSKVIAVRNRARYAAESAADHAFWMLLADRAMFSNRLLGLGQPLQRQESYGEPWMTDGKAHTLQSDEFQVTVTLCDANAGYDVSGANAAQVLRREFAGTEEGDEDLPDTRRQQALTEFLDVFSDYIDSDDFARLYGKERDAYADAGYPYMPRNAPLQYREELYWIDGLQVLVDGAGAEETVGEPTLVPPGMFRLVPPEGFAFGRASRRRGGGSARRPPFFSSSSRILQKEAALTAGELETVLKARDDWWENRLPLDQSLSPDLLARLRNEFSFQESGITTIQSTAVSPGSGIRCSLTITRDCRPGNAAFADTQSELFAYWEKLWF